MRYQYIRQWENGSAPPPPHFARRGEDRRLLQMEQQQPLVAAADGNVVITEQWRIGGMGSGNVATQVIEAIVALAFTVFAIIALVVSNTDAVSRKCGGMDLWNLAIAQMVIGMGVVFAVMCLAAPFGAMCGPEGFAVSSTMVLVGSYATMLGLWVTYLTRAAASDGCTEALSDNFMHAPLLIIIGWISVGVNAMQLLVSFCGCVVTTGASAVAAYEES